MPSKTEQLDLWKEKRLSGKLNYLERAFRNLNELDDLINQKGVGISLRVIHEKIEASLQSIHQEMLERVPAQPSSDQHFGNVTYAQHGDDLMICNLFSHLGIKKPSYLDLGAHDPSVISNTALLYERGSRGVNVEANPALIERFHEMRPGDINLNVGVAPEPGHKNFFMYGEKSGRNTFSSLEVEGLKSTFTVQNIVSLPVVTLSEIITHQCGGKYPDFLSCDIEGLDYDVLSQLPKFTEKSEKNACPKIICVETRRSDTPRMRSLLLEKGFNLYCRMGENLFFVRLDYTSMVY